MAAEKKHSGRGKVPEKPESGRQPTRTDEVPKPPAPGSPVEKKPEQPGLDMVSQLEQKVDAAHERLQNAIEEWATANEELKASNEELASMNEELRATTGELNEKVKELETANNDMANLFNCTEIPTLFLDRRFRIKRFTPATTRLFNLIPTDVGRPIGHIAGSDDDLLSDARQVLNDLTPREREVRTQDGLWFARRMVPYRTTDNRVEGVAITFMDITERKQAADTLRHLAAIVESSAHAIFSKNLDGIIRTWNRGAERLYGYSRDEAVGQSVKLIFPEDCAEELASIMARLRRGEHVEYLEAERDRKDGDRVSLALMISPIRDDDGQVVSASVIGHDITDRKRAELELQLQGQVAANLAEGVALVTASDGLMVYTNERFEKLFGYAPGELLGRHVSILNTGEGEGPVQTAEGIMQALREKGVWTGEAHNVRKDGTLFWSYSSISTFEHPRFGTVWVGALTDITERKQLERELVEVASEAQRRIGRDLHDSVAQELTALNLLAGTLAETLETEPADAPKLVKRMKQGLKRAQQELRAVLRGLLPVAVDNTGLMAALTELATRTQHEGQ
jgi:two-component system CheB/CheR fusion protein